MFELSRRPQAYEDHDRSFPGSVRAFLIESERRVIMHCRSLLEQDGLSADERSRLMRLASRAEAELQALAA
jgi:hypothetical protein